MLPNLEELIQHSLSNINQVSFLGCFCFRHHRNHRALQNATCSLRVLALWDRKWWVWTKGIVPWWWIVPKSRERHALCWQSRWHNDVIKWEHFPRYWPFVWGIHRSPPNSPHKGQWRVALVSSLICAWTSIWVNSRDACDLRRHYDVTVMHIL